jgi:pilus assembly protein CpaE
MAAGQNLNVVAIMRTEASGLQLDEECTGMNGTRVQAHVGNLQDITPDLDIFRKMDVLIIDVDPKSSGEIEALENIVAKKFPAVPVVGTAAGATIQDVRQMMRIGVVDFIPQPITKADLQAALSLAASKRQAKSGDTKHKGTVISFIKGGGGVGATTLAVQAGCCLAADFAKSEKKACLIDLDIQFGTGALYLDLDNRVGVADLMDTPERLDVSLLEGATTSHESGLKLIGAPREVVPLDSMTPEFISALIVASREEFEVALLDLPPAWTEGSYTALEQSDAIILVSQLSVAGVRQTKHQLDTLRMQGLVDAEVIVALNRYESSWGRAVHLKEAEKALGCKVDYCIPNDFKVVSEALNQGVSLSRIKTRSKVEKGVRSLIEGTIRSVEAKRSAGAETRKSVLAE